MKFGKTIESAAQELPQDWRPYLVQYKTLKKSIKNIVRELDDVLQTLNIDSISPASEDGAASAYPRSSACEEPRIIELDVDGNTKEEQQQQQQSQLNGPTEPILAPMLFLANSIDYDLKGDKTGIHPIITIRTKATSPPPPQTSTLSKEIMLDNAKVVVTEAVVTSPYCARPAMLPADEEALDSALQRSNAAGSGDQDKGQSRSDGTVGSGDPECRNNEPQEDKEEKKVVLYLKEDQAFFDLLMQYLCRIRKFENQRLMSYTEDIDGLGALISSLASPSTKDIATWREIFRVYLELDVWSHSESDYKHICSSKEGKKNLEKFSSMVVKTNLVNKFKSRKSREAFGQFCKLNQDLIKLRLFEEMNEEATRKIIKKHDKRTHLVAKTRFQQVVSLDTTALFKGLVYAVVTRLVSVVPQLDDYSCPMCLGIYWRPVRLNCKHVFCSRCVIKASRRKLYDCPICRENNAIYKAGVENIDQALARFLQLYFPREVKAKKNDIQKEIAKEEAEAINYIIATRGGVVKRCNIM